MKTALIMGGTPNLSGPSGVAYLSMKFMSPILFNNSDKFFYTTDKISSKDYNTLKNIGIQTILFDANISQKASNHIKYFSKGILAKFEAFNLINLYDRVIWFDSDQICLKELNEVVNQNNDKDFFITDGGENSNGWSNFIKEPNEVKKWLKHNPKISFKERGICGNFYGVTKTRGGVYSEALNLFKEMESELYGGEQGILFILMQSSFSKKVLLDNKMFTPHPKEWPLVRLLNSTVEDRPYLIHAYSQPKFWNGIDYEPWNFFYKIWLKLGGGDFIHLNKLNFFNLRKMKTVVSRVRSILK